MSTPAPRRLSWGSVTWRGWGSAAIAILATLALAVLAAHHPISPSAALGLGWCWAVVCAWQPRWWLFAVPALLPLMSAAPWTGWVLFDEFDLLLLGTLAGGHAKIFWDNRADGDGATSAAETMQPWHWALAFAVASTFASLAWGFLQAAQDATAAGFLTLPLRWQLQADYLSPLNAVRVGKSLLFAAALLPLWPKRAESHDGITSRALFSWGMLVGLAVAVAGAAWERWLFTGLFNFSAPYRATGWFWEMHVGGAALEAYLALTLPFAAWGLWRTHGPAAKAAAALMLAAGVYVTATTFSRSVFGAVLLPTAILLVALALGAGGRRERPVRARRTWLPVALVATGLALELAAVFWGGSFLRQRLELAGDHLEARMAHWRRGLALLHTPGDWLWGVGLGRLPALYAQGPLQGGAPSLPDGAQPTTGMPGRLHLVANSTDGADGAGVHVALAGPDRDQELGGAFALQQQVGRFEPGGYAVRLRVRGNPSVRLLIKLCEKHQIYERRCYYALVELAASAQPDSAPMAKGRTGDRRSMPWKRFTVPLAELAPMGAGGDGLRSPAGGWVRPAVLSLSVLDATRAVDVAEFRLLDGHGVERTRNGDFSQGLTHWREAAGGYYLPWHIDNLYLEWLVERGATGLLVAVVLVVAALRRLWCAACPSEDVPSASAASWTCATALTAVLLLGLVGSVMDAPRSALLLWLLVLSAAAGRWHGIRALAAPHNSGVHLSRN